MTFDAVVLAGGRGSRLGGSSLGDKAKVELGGRSLLDHVLAGVIGAGRVVCVGANLPSRLPGDPLCCVEQPVGGGPLAAVATGLQHVRSDEVALCAADTPFIGGALAALIDALATNDADAVVLTDADGRRHYLAAMWRSESLRAALRSFDDVSGRSMRSLYDLPHLVVLPVVDDTDAAFDVDTPDDLAVAEERFAARVVGSD